MVGLFHRLLSSLEDGLLVLLLLCQCSHTQPYKDGRHLLPALAMLVGVQAHE